ncbi:ABC transporter permease [Nocardia carnea]|uniref:ABC transporter permease n=1 Tax=Nocardia TaxID=1817 RepID=UPI002458F89B|nr:ABC transporter permease [Nocardia carnea]
MAAVLTENRRGIRTAALVASQIGFVVAVLLGWEWSVRAGVIDSFVVGTPSKILDTLTGWLTDGTLVSNTFVTVFVTVAGYLAALITGIVIGTIAGTFDAVNKVITPFVSFWQGFPRLVFYPFFAVALGYSVGSRMVHVAFVIVFVIIVSTAAGVADVDIDVRHHARILGANRWQVIRDTRLPAAVMWVGTSARITFGFAIQAAIVAEFTGASSGLGYLMVRGQNSFNVNMVWAATVAAIVVAVVVDQLLRLVQERFSRWQVT